LEIKNLRFEGGSHIVWRPRMLNLGSHSPPRTTRFGPLRIAC
jgi:hypothetical protein